MVSRLSRATILHKVEREPETPADEARTVPAARPPSQGRVWGVRGLLTLATLLAILGILAVWANRQVLHADGWGDTSTALLQNTAIRTQVSESLVDGIYNNINVAAQLRSGLPPRLQPLAGLIAGGLRNLAQKVAFDVLGRPRVQEAWRTANVIAARQFINIVEGKSKLVKLSGNAVFLDLRPILAQLSQRFGLPSSLVQSLPPTAGRIKVMASNQVSALQDAVDLVRGLAIVLPAVALLLFALAVGLATGRRRHTLLFVGIDLVIAGLIVLIARNVAGPQVVNALVSTDSAKAAVLAAWTIGTGLVSGIAQATIIFGLVVVLAAWFAGRTRLALALRRSASPWLRERPGIAYGAVLAVLLLIVLWGPIPATRMPIPVLIMIGLAALGTEVLRRQAALEFPDTHIGDTTAAIRGWVDRRRSRRGRASASPAPIAGGSQLLGNDRLARLERLAELRRSGALTQAEFEAEKASLLTPSG